jgi:hypothetical protein
MSIPPNRPNLDFAVIGAAKAGTTALFNMIRTHPRLHLPGRKEIPYFAWQGHSYYDSAADFFADAFEDRGEGQLCGTVSPQYLYGTPVGPGANGELPTPDETTIPRRIRNAYPEAKLIAILRDPVARARSYHRMSTLRGQEDRSFEVAIEKLLEPAALAESRAQPNVLNNYVVLGEYGRLLQGYFDVFPPEQLLVLFHEDLERDPAATCATVFEFLGVDAGFRPPNLGQRYNEGGSRRRFEWLDLTVWQQAAARSTVLKRPWRLLPRSLRWRILKGFDLAVWEVFLWNRVPGDAPAESRPDEETLTRLRAHYQEDTEQLRGMLEAPLPWEAG